VREGGKMVTIREWWKNTVEKWDGVGYVLEMDKEELKRALLGIMSLDDYEAMEELHLTSETKVAMKAMVESLVIKTDKNIKAYRAFLESIKLPAMSTGSIKRLFLFYQIVTSNRSCLVSPDADSYIPFLFDQIFKSKKRHNTTIVQYLNRQMRQLYFEPPQTVFQIEESDDEGEEEGDDDTVASESTPLGKRKSGALESLKTKWAKLELHPRTPDRITRLETKIESVLSDQTQFFDAHTSIREKLEEKIEGHARGLDEKFEARARTIEARLDEIVRAQAALEESVQLLLENLIQ
jgi:hypothetical protein